MRKYLFIFLLIVFLFSFHGFSKPGSGKYFKNSSFIQINDITLHYRSWTAEGTHQKGQILLIHGFGGSTFSWEQIAPVLSSYGYQVLAVDVPPFGFSEKRSEMNGSIGARAQLINELIKNLDSETKWHLVGHSMGGAIAAGMALLDPEQFLTLNLTAPALFDSLVPGKYNVPFLFKIPGIASFAGNIAQEWFITHDQIQSMLESAYGEEPAKEQVEQYYRPLSMEGTSRAILNNARRAKEPKNLNIGNLHLPVLAIWGEKDTWVPYQDSKKMLELIPSYELEIIPNAGHNPMETHPDIYLQKYLAYLEERRKKRDNK